eukprot:10062083-Heterocapsa_arctica.AAC.1
MILITTLIIILIILPIITRLTSKDPNISQSYSSHEQEGGEREREGQAGTGRDRQGQGGTGRDREGPRSTEYSI